MMAGDGHTEADDPVLLAAATAFGDFTTMCMELIEARRESATDDIIGILTNAYDDGELLRGGTKDGVHSPVNEELSNDELLMFLTLLVVAGNETTRNAISGGLWCLSRFPDQRDRLLADPSLFDTAVDEIVRYVSPVLSFSRTVTEDHELGGQQLRAGETVFMLYQSANRDEDVFDEPDEFRVDRDPNPHVAFGIGTHYCLGANLARAEIKVVFEELLERLSDIRVADVDQPLRRGNSSLVLALESLPAIFTPEQRLG